MVEPPPRLDVARIPTPIEELRRFGPRGGARIWIKRDDLTGNVLSGNKIRKLQYAAKEALDERADTLVTCGGLQSNHCRATAALARRVGLEATLVLRGTKPDRAEGNFLLDQLFGADIRFITPEQYAHKDDVMARVADELRANGRNPYVVAEGCSMAIGTWGYIEAAAEIATWQRDHGIEFDAVVAATGSGGTAAGLELGARMHGLKRVVSINVCDDEAYFRELIFSIASEADERFGLATAIARDEIEIVDGYVGDGYGKTRPEELRALTELARTEGLVLDPVYGGKAWRGMLCELDSGRLAGCANVLFVHTGGVFGLFPHADALRDFEHINP